MKHELIDLEKVLEISSLSRTAMYYLIKEGQFPSPIKIGKRKSVWSKQSIEEWVEMKFQESLEATKAKQKKDKPVESDQKIGCV